MSQSDNIHLLDLPDELLMAIFNKLKPTDLLWSIMNVNKRLDKISCDRHFTTQMIDLTAISVLDDFCSYILPRIRNDVTCLAINSLNIERILLAAKYPNLTSLTLLYFQHKDMDKYFLEQSDISCILKNQIKKLVVQQTDNSSIMHTVIYNMILTNCMNLINLTFKSIYPIFFHGLNSNQYTSSILIELNINVSYFSDCLFLLDGCLPQLKVFRIEIKYIEITPPWLIDEVKLTSLLNMKIFSLTCYRSISMHTYDNWILPLLHRMSNLDQLSLWLSVEGNRFLTGIDLDKQILSFLPRLLTFSFRISTGIRGDNSVQLENDDIQHTFPIGQYNQFEASCSTLYFPGGSRFCYIISQPYTLDRLDYINQNNFPSGIFTSVRSLKLCTNNQLAFEHEFFIRISRSFTCLEHLYIFGKEPQLYKNQILSPIEFLRLRMLIFDYNIHFDYVEQFLCDTKARLPSLRELQINYEDLLTVTNVFTYTGALANCARVTQLYINQQFTRTSAFNFYFPSLRTICQCVKPMWYQN